MTAMTWDPNNASDSAPVVRTDHVDIETLDDGRCKASTWRAPKPQYTQTYENHFGPGGFNRCIGHDGHANPLHKDEWGHVFSVDPFRVVRNEAPQEVTA